jgi:hypothetical protein
VRPLHRDAPGRPHIVPSRAGGCRTDCGCYSRVSADRLSAKLFQRVPLPLVARFVYDVALLIALIMLIRWYGDRHPVTSPAITTCLTLKDQHSVEDVHDHRERLFTVGTNQTRFVNRLHAKGGQYTGCTITVLQGFLWFCSQIAGTVPIDAPHWHRISHRCPRVHSSTQWHRS